jgi:hypothetical protein
MIIVNDDDDDSCHGDVESSISTVFERDSIENEHCVYITEVLYCRRLCAIRVCPLLQHSANFHIEIIITKP